MPDEIRAEHVKLSWMPPEDDGGTPITSYLVRYMDIDSGEWVTACTSSTPNATATGLKPGHLYQFEVSAINKEGQSEPIFTGDPILAENPYSKFYSKTNLVNWLTHLFVFRTAQRTGRAEDCRLRQQVGHTEMGQAQAGWWPPYLSLYHSEERQVWRLV